ncbi:MAG: sulfatase [Bacteroidota bacterium]
MKYLLVFLACFLAFFSCKNAPDAPAPTRPNILFIMTDDHANAAMSAYGSQLLQTPNMDRIGREGIRFTNSFVTNSICAPSRAVLLTGKYSHLNGLRDNYDAFDGNQTTFPKLLQQAGYQTFMVGKWHLKTQPTGFDFWSILIDQGEYYSPRFAEMSDTLVRNGYATDVITDLALKTLRERDAAKPFALLLHHKAPHRNWMPNTKHLQLFENETIPLPKTFWDDYATRSATARDQDMRIEDMFLSYDLKLMPGDYEKDENSGGLDKPNPEQWFKDDLARMTPEQRAAWDAHYEKMRRDFREKHPTGKALIEWKYQRYMKDYLRCVASVDENIGRVLAYLDSAGLAKNTLVVYTSDQGFYLGEHGWYDKRFMYEYSLRMPLVMRYPPDIQPNQVTNAMTLNLDFAPTILDFAGANIPPDMQGRSLRPILQSKKPGDWRTAMYYHYYEFPGAHKVKKHYGIRTERHKLIHFYVDNAWELYDLESDPEELHNLYGDPAHRELAEELKKELTRLREELKVPPEN